MELQTASPSSDKVENIPYFSSMNNKLNFPAKLYRIVDSENPEIVGWERDGQSFRIHNYCRLEKEILPKYFRR